MFPQGRRNLYSTDYLPTSCSQLGLYSIASSENYKRDRRNSVHDMARPPSRSSQYSSGHTLHTQLASHGPRPTLPSLRSQVGEYLSEAVPHPAYPHSVNPDPFGHLRPQSISSTPLMQPPLGPPGSFRGPPPDTSRRLSSSTSMGHYRSVSPGGHPSSSNHPAPAPFSSGPPPPMAATRSTYVKE